MRIRKRFPPPSDLQLSNHIPAVVQQEKSKNECLPSDLPSQPQPSDQLGGKPTRWAFFGGNCNQDNMKDVEATKDEKGREKEMIFGSNHNHNNKESTPQELGSNLHPQLPASSDLVKHGRWCEGEKVKKRRDESHTSIMNKETAIMELVNMKSKTNNKFPQENGSLVAEEEGFDNITSNKKRKSGSVILEGSRCSHANGRGWRCCQQTLVGYSLCEHHLGKGRSLRTITTAVDNKEKFLLSNVDNKMVLNHDEKRPISKKKKLGMVKARSLSSLLGQSTAVAALMDVDKDIAAFSAPNLNSAN